jgi:hypothetical protein
MATITETIVADVELKGLDKFGQLKVSMDTVAKSTDESAKKMKTLKAQAAEAAKQLGVNTKIGKRFVNTALNAGFAAEDQAKAMQKIKEVAEKTGKPVEIIEKAWEGLARTLQNADEATENLEDALAFQARAGIPEAEKAAASYAQTIGGGTQALKQLTGVGELYAKQLDQIRDADLKAKLTTELARKELNRKREAIERVKDSYLTMSLRMKAALGPSNLMAIKMMGKAVKALAVGVGVGLVGAFALAISSIKKFAETNREVKRDVDLLDKSVDALQVALGSALVGGSQKAGDNLDKLRGFVDNLTEAVKKNAEGIHSFAVTTINSSIDIFEALVSGIGAYGKAVAFTIDNLELLIAAFGSGIIILGGSVAFIIQHATNQFKMLAQAFVRLLDLTGQADKVPASLRKWSQSIVGLGDVVSTVDKLGGDMFERLGEGWKNTRGVDDYQKRVQSTLESLKALRDVRTGKAGSGDANADEDQYLSDWMDNGVSDDPWDMDDGGSGGKGGKGGKKGPLPDVGQMGSQHTEFIRIQEEQREQLRLTTEAVKKATEGYTDFGETTRAQMGGMALDALNDFGSGAAKAFGVAAAGGESFSTAIGKVMKNILGQMANQFGQFFVLKGAAITADPTLGGPAFGIPLIAAGLALQAFGGFLGHQKTGSSGASASTGAAGGLEQFQPRELQEEKPEETTIVIQIAGETIGPAIWDQMNEGMRLGHVAQFA